MREVNPPKDVDPLDWRLLTTHEVEDVEKAWQTLGTSPRTGWYQARWVIEQLLRVAKSQGLQLEDSQLASADRLVKLTAAAIKAACIYIQLVQEHDGAHRLPASAVFSEPESETLKALLPTLEAGQRGRRTHTRPGAWPARAGSSRD